MSLTASDQQNVTLATLALNQAQRELTQDPQLGTQGSRDLQSAQGYISQITDSGASSDLQGQHDNLASLLDNPSAVVGLNDPSTSLAAVDAQQTATASANDKNPQYVASQGDEATGAVGAFTTPDGGVTVAPAVTKVGDALSKVHGLSGLGNVLPSLKGLNTTVALVAAAAIGVMLIYVWRQFR